MRNPMFGLVGYLLFYVAYGREPEGSGSHITISQEIVGHKRTAEVLRLAGPKLPSHIHARAAFHSK